MLNIILRNIFIVIALSYPCLSLAADSSIGYSYVTVTNNTDKNISIMTTLTTADTEFKRNKDWDEVSQTLAPYETKQVLWFSRNKDVKNNQHYQFDIVASRDSEQDNVHITLDEKGNVYGSDLSIQLKLPDADNKTILKKDGLERFTSQFWQTANVVYARSWLPSGNTFNSFQFVIDNPQPTSIDTSANNQISVLAYNVQMMPFYANVVDDLNQPHIRVKDIPAKIADYDVVILEELFDRDLRNEITQLMTAYYPFHTKVVDDTNAKILTGGVMIYSKWPIVNEKQIVYQASSGGDSLAAKGAMYAAVNKNGRMYHVFGTHLQAGGDDKAKAAKQQQLQELNDFINSLDIPFNQPVLIGGDFNINEFSQSASMLSALNVNVIENIGYRYSYDGTVDTMAVSDGQSRIDYVFYSNLYAQPKVAWNKVFVLRDLDNEKMWPKFDLSDHFSIMGYFEFE